MQNETSPNVQMANAKQEFSKFYKENLPQTLKKIFFRPTEGTSELFANGVSSNVNQSLILLGSTGILFMIVPYLLIGSTGRQYIGFSPLLQLGITVLLFLFLVSAVSFCLKSLKSKAGFKQELFTGALCAIPLLLILAILTLISLFSGGADSMLLGLNLLQILTGSSIIVSIVTLYSLLMAINIIKISLQSAAIGDAASWYLAPLVLIVAFYLSVKITSAIF